MATKKRRWYTEYFSPYSALMHGIDKWLLSEVTPYQHLELVMTHDFGKSLFLDGKLQSSQADEFIYHDILVHPALVLHPEPKSVCIIGGGEGATLREALKHSTVQRAVMIDIDQRVIDIAKDFLPEWHQGSFEDKRAQVLAMDGRRYLEESQQQFDCIIIDISEPVEEGPAYKLFTRQFYQLVSQRLAKDGTICLQAGSASPKDHLCFASVLQTLRTVFPVVTPMAASILSFTLPWGFCLASKGPDPRALAAGEVDRRLAARGVPPLGFYDGECHESLMRLPRYLRQALAAPAQIIEDDKPLFTFTVQGNN
jgi:spermidine synthase